MKKTISSLLIVCVVVSMLSGAAFAIDGNGVQENSGNISVSVVYQDEYPVDNSLPLYEGHLVPIDSIMPFTTSTIDLRKGSLSLEGTVSAKGTLRSQELFQTSTGKVSVLFMIPEGRGDIPFVIDLYNSNGTRVQTATVVHKPISYASAKFSGVPADESYYIGVTNPNNVPYEVLVVVSYE